MTHSGLHAVIDLGTNTFHLLIFRFAEGRLEVVFKRRIFVKLAENGIEEIGAIAQQRALAAIREFSHIMHDHGVRDVRAVGTAALRKAANAHDLLKQIQQATDIDVEVISGEDEARYIAQGVAMVAPDSLEDALIMDIGGGSVEFILSSAGGVAWTTSLPIGVAVLYNRFHRSDPISAKEEEQLRMFLKEKLQPLAVKLRDFIPKTLIGASGTFDVIADMLGSPGALYASFPVAVVTQSLQTVIHSTLDERLANNKIPPTRADVIVVATILIEEVLQLHAFAHLGISSYAMKEGIAQTLNF